MHESFVKSKSSEADCIPTFVIGFPDREKGISTVNSLWHQRSQQGFCPRLEPEESETWESIKINLDRDATRVWAFQYKHTSTMFSALWRGLTEGGSCTSVLEKPVTSNITEQDLFQINKWHFRQIM